MESPITRLRATEKTLEKTKIELARTRGRVTQCQKEN